MDIMAQEQEIVDHYLVSRVEESLFRMNPNIIVCTMYMYFAISESTTPFVLMDALLFHHEAQLHGLHLVDNIQLSH